ncbi:UNVERIFIED_CONTAM: hypothetical protein Sangu_1000700 [Sesamum angustifolium]|uniref:Reverse transcriptase Ty1/copia-type domain-containing protein n=1 Tax=Sesamum angustifolium TaxID=2727405 RepID=A0AAW2PE90_9LAMI
MAGSSIDMITKAKRHLDRLFTIKDSGVAKYFLGFEIARSPQELAVTQTKYIRDIITDVGMLTARSATTPLPFGIKFTDDVGALLTYPNV